VFCTAIVSDRNPPVHAKRRLLGGALLRICSSFPEQADYTTIYSSADMCGDYARGLIQVHSTTSLLSSSSDS
jgi:hypothetical protein